MTFFCNRHTVGEEIAATLKEVFTKAVRDDPGSAPDVMRTIAEALAEAGATAEDIAETVRQAMEAGLAAAAAQDRSDGMVNGSSGSGPSPDDILDLTETAARILAEAGAGAEEIAAAMKTALDAAK